MRGTICRGLRLELVAGLGIALAMPMLSVVAADAQGISTKTTLTAGTLSGCTQALTITVTGASGQPAAGAVAIEDELNGSQVQLADVALNAQGSASPTVSLTGGVHYLTAVYAGNATYQTSTSSQLATGNVTSPCQFTVALAPATLSLTAGESATVVATITPSPDYTNALTAPTFITLSCSGLPDQAFCTFTPETVEILPGAGTALTSSMVLGTQAQGTAASLTPADHPHANSVAWALMLPGALGLGGLAWGARRRRWLNRLTLLALVGLVTMLGATACNPRYYYYNHGPPVNIATPSGTYTVTITAQSSNGVTAITIPTTMVLTVQ